MSGRIEVVCGPMFSGKTRELILRVERAVRANRGVQVFVPMRDIRHGLGEVISHAKQDLQSIGISATPIADAVGLVKRVRSNVRVVALDEVQFFDESLVDQVQELAFGGRRVILAGLDMDYRGKPFGCMPNLMAVADDVSKIPAVCVRCGEDARYTFRKVDSGRTILLGAEESYEARCASCFIGG